MKEYFIGEDLPFGVVIEFDGDVETAGGLEDLIKVANEKLGQAWTIMNAALAEAGLGMWVGSRYDDDMRITLEDGTLIYGPD